MFSVVRHTITDAKGWRIKSTKHFTTKSSVLNFYFVPVGERHAFFGKTRFERVTAFGGLTGLDVGVPNSSLCVCGLIGLGFNVLNSSLCCCSLTGLGFNVPNSSLCVCSLTGLGFNIPNSSLCVWSLIGLGFNVLNSYYVAVISLV